MWINGKKVGFSKDLRLPAEFDISSTVHEGTNTVVTEVIRGRMDLFWRSGSLAHGWHVPQCVARCAAGNLYLADVFAKPTLDGAYQDGLLTVVARLGDVEKAGGYQVEMQIIDSTGNPVFNQFICKTFQFDENEPDQVTLEQPVISPMGPDDMLN